jgi:hypothetical protein
MIYLRKGISAMAIFSAIGLLISSGGCKKDDPAPPVPPRTTTYELVGKDVLGITGTVTFTETSGTVVTIEISLNGAPAGTHPAEVCMNTAVEGGMVVLVLNPVETSGKSTTAVTAMNFSQLIVYDGFIKVLKSSSEPNVILAQGDIGGNVFTGNNKTYSLDTIGVFGVSGTALFQQRSNNATLVTLTITGAITGDVYPATINLGSIASVGGGPVVAVLNHVDGTNGKSFTNIRKLESGIDVTYDNWMVYDGYINIYQTSVGLGNIICHGNIGSN